MRTKLLASVAAGIAIMLGCVETTSVEAPAEVYPSTSFEVTVNTVLVQAGSSSYRGHLAILSPVLWSVDSVYANGYGYSGPMLNDSSPDSYVWLFNQSYPPSIGYQWSSFVSPDYTLHGFAGDTGSATVTIMSNDSLGTFTLAFLAGVEGGLFGPQWLGDPCSCTVEVAELHFQQETWGHIKSSF